MSNTQKVIEGFEDIHNEECVEPLQECASILDSKGKDYGRNNFIRASRIATQLCDKNITPQDVANVLVGVKLARIVNLDNMGATPENESVKDTVRDLLNYIVLSRRERRRSTDEK